MATFREVLQDRRKAHGLSRAQLAKLIGKSPQYVAALESKTDPKLPSLETLRALINVLATWPEKPGPSGEGASRNWSLVLELAMAAIGLEIQFEPPVSVAHQLKREAEDVKAQIWVVSEIPIDLLNRDFARVAAENIRKGVSYTYFFPFASPFRTWPQAFALLIQYLGAEADLLNQHVRVYQISDCAFPRHVRILEPEGSSPFSSRGVYSQSEGLMFYPESGGEFLITLRHLLHEVALSSAAEGARGAIGRPSTGFIRRVFPSSTK